MPSAGSYLSELPRTRADFAFAKQVIDEVVRLDRNNKEERVMFDKVWRYYNKIHEKLDAHAIDRK